NVSDFIVSDGDNTHKYTFVGEREVSRLTLYRRTDNPGTYDPTWYYGTGFLIYSPENVLSYVVYFTDGDPEAEPDFGYPDGAILIPVDISGTAALSEVVPLIVDAVEQDPNFSRDFILYYKANREDLADTQLEIWGIDNGEAVDAIDMIGKKYITNITNTSNPVITVPKHGFTNGTVVIITDTGEPLLDNQVFTINKIDDDTVDISTDLSSLTAPLTRGRMRQVREIDTISAGPNPEVKTTDTHLLEPGNRINFIHTGVPE